MDENEKLEQDKLREAGQSSAGKNANTSAETFTKEQVQKFINDAKSEAGRERLEAIKELGEVKAKLATNEADHEDTKTEIAALQEEIDQLGKDDPAKGDYIKLVKSLRVKETQLNADKKAEDERIRTNTERLSKADEHLRGANIATIAGEYTDGDAKWLLSMCDVAESKTEEQIRRVAENLFKNKKNGDKSNEEDEKHYSGLTNGGGPDLNALSNKQLLHKAYTPKR